MPRLARILPLVLLLTATCAAAQEPCIIGNLNPPFGPPVESILQGKKAIAYFVLPRQQCACLEPAAQLQHVYIMLHFTPWQVPQILQVHAGIRKAIPLPGFPSLFQPDGWFYESASVTVPVTTPGPLLLQVPAINARWMDMLTPYFLTVTFDTPIDAGLQVDALDMPAMAWISPDGNLWQDMFGPAKTGGGKAIIWGDVICGAANIFTGTSVAPTSGLSEAYPNPFNPRTHFTLELAGDGPARVTVHDTRGALVRTLLDERLAAGRHDLSWDGRDDRGRQVAAGLYVLRAEIPTGTTTRNVLMLK